MAENWTKEEALVAIRSVIAGLEWHEREDFFRRIIDGWCRHCGWEEPEGTYCCCMKDD